MRDVKKKNPFEKVEGLWSSKKSFLFILNMLTSNNVQSKLNILKFVWSSWVEEVESPKKMWCNTKTYINKYKWSQWVCVSVSDLGLVELDQSRPGSVAAVVQHQVGQDGQTLLVWTIVRLRLRFWCLLRDKHIGIIWNIVDYVTDYRACLFAVLFKQWHLLIGTFNSVGNNMMFWVEWHWMYVFT